MSGVDFLSNAFLKKDFRENYVKLQNQVKKTFESALETNKASNLGDLSHYSSDYEDEEIFAGNDVLKLWINNEEIEVPADLVKVEDLKDILNKEVFETVLSPEEQEHLRAYLPKNVDQDKILEDLFAGKSFAHTSPLEVFHEKVKAGCYTKTFQKEREIETRLAGIYTRNYYENITNFLNTRLEDGIVQKEKKMNATNLVKRNAAFDLESISQDSELSIDSINDVRVENSFGEVSDCETFLEEAKSEAIKMPAPDTDDELMQNRKFEAQRAMAVSATTFSSAPKKTTTTNNNNEPAESAASLSMSAPKGANKAVKNILTIKLSSKDWVDRYREQERDRYNNPTKPWIFQTPDGASSIVAPVIKKAPTAANSKPREHFLLKADRPSYITILCLVRDAAARLPNGEGTRADICELLKESQYIVETISDDKLSSVVSGALDRLHYEDDPCVKYDSDKKLWIYLHRDRSEEYGPWIDQNDPRSSKKKEYNEKYKVTKKLKTEKNSSTRDQPESEKSSTK